MEQTEFERKRNAWCNEMPIEIKRQFAKISEKEANAFIETLLSSLRQDFRITDPGLRLNGFEQTSLRYMASIYEGTETKLKRETEGDKEEIKRGRKKQEFEEYLNEQEKKYHEMVSSLYTFDGKPKSREEVCKALSNRWFRDFHSYMTSNFFSLSYANVVNQQYYQLYATFERIVGKHINRALDSIGNYYDENYGSYLRSMDQQIIGSFDVHLKKEAIINEFGKIIRPNGPKNDTQYNSFRLDDNFLNDSVTSSKVDESITFPGNNGPVTVTGQGAHDLKTQIDSIQEKMIANIERLSSDSFSLQQDSIRKAASGITPAVESLDNKAKGISGPLPSDFII